MKRMSVWKRILLVNSLIAVLIVAVYAWFALWDNASVRELDTQITDAGYLKISQDGGLTWSDGLALDLGTACVVREMSGNGLSLYQPIYGMYDIEGYESADSAYYIEKTFTFESDVSQDVYLTGASFLAPADVNGNLSNLGNFSRDYIAGAVRVAFFEVTEDETYRPVYIWAPNSTFEFTGTGVEEQGSVEAAYSYQTGTQLTDLRTVSTEGRANGVSADGGFVWGNIEQPGVKPLLSFTTQNSQPVQGTIVMRVWLEGSDRECVKALYNGRFRMYFEFDGAGEE